MSLEKQTDPTKNLNEFNKFLQNNVEFLKQKYKEHFVVQFPFQELQTKSKIEIGIKFIYDVFSFEKYEKDQKMNATLRKSLRQNILTFIKSSPSKEGKQFDSEQGIKLLKYCIQNNEMFAVHYDKKQKKKQQSPQKSLQQSPQKEQNSEQNPHETEQKQDEQMPDIAVKQQTIEKIQPLNKNSFISARAKQKSQPINDQMQKMANQFGIHNKTQEQRTRLQLLKKQAKLIFEFYCKQQLNSGGPNATFDKILHQSNTMTLGKFIAFANTTGILYTTKVQAYKPKNLKVLDKKTINEEFKKASKAQKEIDFQQFFVLISALNEVEDTVFQKLNMNKDQNHNKIIRKLRYLNAPFNMKGPNSKDIQTNVDQKPFIPITTGHSGKFQACLKQDIVDRRQKLRLMPYQPYPNPNPVKMPSYLPFNQLNQSMLRQSKFLQNQMFDGKMKGLNHFLTEKRGGSKTTMNEKKQVSKIRLQNSRIQFQNGQNVFDRNQIDLLQNLIVQDQANDDQFLKDYKIPKLNSNAGLKKKNNNSLLQRSLQEGNQSNRRFSGIKSQRKNVVGQLKQRIKQVQKSERKQLTSLQNKRKVVSTYNNRY